MQTQFRTIEPTRVQVAREIAGLTKAQLADYLEVSARTINTFENEGAPAYHADALAAATGRPLGFFTNEPFDRIDVEKVHFRAAKKISKRAKSESTSYGSVGLSFYEELVAPYNLPVVDVPTLDNLEPEQAAREIRVRWLLGEDPLPNLVQLLESRGVRILSLPKSIEKLDAFSDWYTDGYPYIFLNISKSAERVRFDLAHELGHLVLHSREVDPGRDIEKEADLFAAELLMPARAVRRDMPAYADVEAILRLKKAYRVSAVAMNRRGGELGILKEWGQRQNYVELSKLGFRKDEPGGLVLDRSRVLPFVLDDMKQKGKSLAALAARVGVTLQDVNGFT
ncbi:MAG: ImmA/IrrE family metallo-endopeptidase, partial [Rothia sp. (in: high G+C Gram-positive bacteria)]|nr:ImmA/IrrE family metallo-endopeptidase [Rothia sp. (in: high G+C Gram-positive bacteria)]